MHRLAANLSYVSRGAVGFGERERIAIFSAALRWLFWGEKRMAIGLSPWVFVSFLPRKKKRKIN